MKIVAISDTHQEYLQDLPSGDILIHSGDFSLLPKNVSSNRELMISELTDLRNWFNSIKDKYKHMILVPGNHDWIFEVDYQFASDFLENVIVLNDRSIEIDGIKFWGSPINLEYRDWAFNRAPGEEILKHWNAIPKDTDILITHGPPLGILDRAFPEKNSPELGDVDLLNTVENINLKAHIFGHIHGSHGVIEKNGTLFVNASIMDESYKPTFKPIVLDI